MIPTGFRQLPNAETRKIPLTQIQVVMGTTRDLMVPAMQARDPFDTTVFAPLEPKLKKLADDLVWWASTLAAARTQENQ